MGVGPGCYMYVNPTGNFAHCAFAECFADSGIIELIIYVVILLRFIKRQYKRWRRYRNRRYAVFLVYGLTFVLQNIFYAFYLLPWLMAFFIMVASEAERFHSLRMREQFCEARALT